MAKKWNSIQHNIREKKSWILNLLQKYEMMELFISQWNKKTSIYQYTIQT